MGRRSHRSEARANRKIRKDAELSHSDDRRRPLGLADGATLDEVDQEQHDRNDQQNVEQSTKRVAGHEAEEPEDQEKKNEEQHRSLLAEFTWNSRCNDCAGGAVMLLSLRVGVRMTF
jgi:hypothetical protein